MHLDVNGDESFKDPSVDQIRDAIDSLDDDTFAILSRGDEDYIQAYRHSASDYQLEYRAGSEDEHYGCAANGITSSQIQNAFEAFSAGADDWQAPWTWRKMDI